MQSNLELSKELYDLSGWRTGDVERDNPTSSSYDESNIICFRYDADFLLIELPPRIDQDDGLELWLQLAYVKGDQWGAFYYDYRNWGFYRNYADTPEDALAKLAIELFKTGVLKKAGE